MRLHLLLPTVKPGALDPPRTCPTSGCPGGPFVFRQAVPKLLRDTRLTQVCVHRYECLACHASFRVYPPGVSAAQTSARLRGLGVLLYLFGLSYGATALALAALGHPLAKSTIYEAVQAAARRLPDLQRHAVFQKRHPAALGADATSVRCNGAWLTLGLTCDAVNGLTLSIDVLEGTDAATLQEWLTPILTATGAGLLVTDDADAFKQAADQLGVPQQVCKAHVRRNTEALVAELLPLVATDGDGSLAAVGVSGEQAAADLRRLRELVEQRPVVGEGELHQIYQRYVQARKPGKGEKWGLAYRLRQLFLDRVNLWGRLTRYRRWRGPAGERIDGTNNGSERGIGWWIKERYRSMRGYKRVESAVGVSRLLAWAGNALSGPGADLQTVVG